MSTLIQVVIISHVSLFIDVFFYFNIFAAYLREIFLNRSKLKLHLQLELTGLARTDL